MNETRDKWASRLSDMETWYRDLLNQGEASAERALTSDYAPYSGFLGALRGRVLDVGGGAGLTARYLDPDCDYWVIDPAAVWEEAGWQAFGDGFRTRRPVNFVRGVGEKLPFDDHAFDAALAFWSLNHAADPERCVAEMARVVKPGGCVLIVLEDMEPSWLDIAGYALQRVEMRCGRRVEAPMHWGQQDVTNLRETLARKMPGAQWPLQSDHLRIAEPALISWLKPRLRICTRSWRSGFLTFELINSPL